MTPRGEIRIRLAEPGDLPRCGEIWRDALNDYFRRLNLPEVPDQLESIGRLHAHALATDPGRFMVAIRDADPEGRNAETAGAGAGAGTPQPGASDRPPEPGASGRGERLIAFASALERGDLWYLSMLFVEPGEQAAGLGRKLLARVLPPFAQRSDRALAVASDSAQPISNALYASLGMVPRVPMYHLVGRPSRMGALPPLPEGTSGQALAPEIGALPAGVHAIDREVLGFEHPEDHRWALEGGRLPFVYRDAEGDVVAYGYASPVGHIGPVATRQAALLPAVIDHLLAAVQPRGASAVWVPGTAGETFTGLIRAGMRIDGFPVLLLWSRPFADLSRYLPLSPGLL